MSQKELKFLTVPFEIKGVSESDEGEGIVEGYASVFNVIDQGFDVVEKGAFKKSLKDKKGKFPILADHNPYMQIGWSLDAKEDDYGLWTRNFLDIKNNQKAKEKFSLAQKALEIKADSGLSIGYMTIKAEPDRDKPMVRRLKELKLFEWSFVTFPMNTDALVTAAKSFVGASSIDQAVTAFLESSLDNGYSKEDLILALERAAKGIEKPDQNSAEIVELIHFIDQSRKSIFGT